MAGPSAWGLAASFSSIRFSSISTVLFAFKRHAGTGARTARRGQSSVNSRGCESRRSLHRIQCHPQGHAPFRHVVDQRASGMFGVRQCGDLFDRLAQQERRGTLLIYAKANAAAEARSRTLCAHCVGRGGQPRSQSLQQLVHRRHQVTKQLRTTLETGSRPNSCKHRGRLL